ncbi:putative hydroxypyruvate isomerase isoform X2 [Pocillopora damicornis]|uniref:putative hydroxypyruvate isomerase isoform X2 n=1 Tax=Pocillopora damicornis TaxID=46731 RepID=UPI000F5555A6|nr:putative hydroxypyruvate isomerase isoform X2 [Pocillopora damicornis]XP_027055892.1 putative hydroxypyruvate isomerase isoform X2 [Pocillopora damicornis]XP_027055893.1 putative hydroxypyruvate isomerase isoform X2 [Pocillopora damicornis]
MALKFAANISFTFLEHKNFLDRYQAAKRAGFKAVESGFPPDIPIEELSNARENAQIEQILMNAFDGGSQGLAAVPGREEEFKQCLELSIKYAEAVKCTRLHVLAGVFPEGVTSTDNKSVVLWEETYVKNMKYAAQRLEENGITLLVEPISTIPGYFLTNSQQAINLIKKVDHRNIKLLLDLFHHQRTTGNITQTLNDSMPYIGHIQISQVPSRNEPDLDGEINYPFVFYHIAKLGYKGWIGCEYHPRGQTEDGLGWLAPYLVDQ